MESKMAASRMGEGQLLHQLLQEAVSNEALGPGALHEEEPDAKQLQSMIDNYQNHVMRLTQQSQTTNDISLNELDIHKARPCSSETPSDGDSSSNHYAHSSDPRDLIDDHNDLEALKSENVLLKQHIAKLQTKNAAFRRLELSYERIDNEFNQIMTRREQQERLEQAARQKMEQTIQRLANENELLQRQLEKLNLVVVQQHQLDPDRSMPFNAFVTDLIPQQKELLAIKSRQQIEIDAQNATLEEQRNHIEMLEKALANAQERLTAKDRAAADAMALVDKVAHQQKLLQEAREEKQKMQEDFARQRSQLEIELAQLKMQLAKENVGPGKTSRVIEEDGSKLRTLLQQKDDKIQKLEAGLTELRNKIGNDGRSDNLLDKLRVLEKERDEKDKRILDLLDEKERIHGQWADERRSLDHRLRLLEQDLRHLMGVQLSNYGSCYSPNGSPYNSNKQLSENPTRQRSARNEPPLYKSEDLKSRHADSKLSNDAWQSGKTTASTSQYMSPVECNHTNVPPILSQMVQHGSGTSSSTDSVTNSLDSQHNENRASPTAVSNRMASKMPSNIIDGLSRRRLNPDPSKMSKRTAVALGTAGYRRTFTSSDEGKPTKENGGSATSDSCNGRTFGNTTVVTVNNNGNDIPCIKSIKPTAGSEVAE